VLSKYGSEAASVFDLLGRKEVDLTAAVGWVLSESPLVRAALMRHLGLDASAAEVDIALEVADKEGRTDIELTGPNTKVIIEAKQGWLLPGEAQLLKYRRRFEGYEDRLMISMSDSSELWARDQLPREVEGTAVRHVSWDVVRSIVTSTKTKARGRERTWIEELEVYMGRATSTRPNDSQWVYCVVVSKTAFAGISFRDFVIRDRVYFHPFGDNSKAPKSAPNFLCFRWGGRVRQVNRVEHFEVVPRLAERWPEAANEISDGPHIIYDLGPDIPIPAVSTKGTYATGRVWCLLDQLLVHETLADAVHASKKIDPW
jgi:hypothetical protein